MLAQLQEWGASLLVGAPLLVALGCSLAFYVVSSRAENVRSN